MSRMKINYKRLQGAVEAFMPASCVPTFGGSFKAYRENVFFAANPVSNGAYAKRIGRRDRERKGIYLGNAI